MIRSVVVVAALLLAAGIASAGPLPKLDVQSTCRRAQPLSGGEKSAYQGCVSDELDARKELAKTWSSYRASSQGTCLQETKIGGAPSYVELLTCLQLDRQAAEASRENQKLLDLPSGRSPSGSTLPRKR